MSHIVRPDLTEPLDLGLWYDLGAGAPPFSSEGVIRPEYLNPSPSPLGACIRYPYLFEERQCRL